MSHRTLLRLPLAMYLALVLVTGSSATLPARSQPAADVPTIRATMFHHVFRWTAKPGEAFEVTLTDAAGEEKAYRWVQADAMGEVTVKLASRTNDFAFQNVEPGDRLHIARFAGTELLDLKIPDASVDMSDDGRRIVGRAPAGARLDLDIEPRGSESPFAASLVAADDGSFSMDLPEAARVQPGEGGKVSFDDPAGHRFDLQFARRQVEVVLGSARAEGRATLQMPIRIRRLVEINGRRVPRSLGRLNPRPDGVGTDGRWIYADDAAYRITAGTVVTFSQTGGPLDRMDEIVRVMPDLAIQVDGPRLVSGHGPIGAVLGVDVLAPDSLEPAGRWSVSADAQGLFVLALPEILELGAGWRAVLRQDLGEGVSARVEIVLPRYRLSVNAARLDTQVAAFQTLTVTLRAPDGVLRAQKVARADGAGSLTLQMDDGKVEPKNNWDILEPFQPGDIVEIDPGRGDPTRLVVPVLSATSDPDSEAIHGRAAPGATLDLELHDGGQTLRRSAMADAAGSYTLDLKGVADLEPGVQSMVSWAERRGHVFYVLTAPLGLQVSAARSYAEFWPYLGYPISVTLTTPELVMAGRGLDPTVGLEDPLGLPASLYPVPVWFEDHLGATIRIRPGDEVQVQAGGDSARVKVLPLEGRVHVEDDLIIGRTAPGTQLRIETAAEAPGNVTATLQADGNGYFSQSFSGQADIRYNTTVSISALLGRHRILYALQSPGLTLDISAARISGSVEPEVDLVARLGETGALRARAAGRADAKAGFDLILRDGAGEAVEPLVGEVLSILAPDAQLMREIEWTVPRLTLAVDSEAGSIRGSAEPDALVVVRRSEALGYPGIRSGGLVDGRAFPRIAPDGAWSVSETWRRVRGSRTEAHLTLPSGHIATRTQTDPLLNVQHGGSMVCSVGQPHHRVTVIARDAMGQPVARAAGRTDADGRFEFELADDAGRPVRTAEGTRVEADIGGEAVEVLLGPLNVQIDVAASVITAQVSPDAKFEYYYPARSCLYDDDDQTWRTLTGRGGGSTASVSRAKSDGTVSQNLYYPEFLENGLDAAVYTAEGHRYYRPVYMPPSVLAYVGTDRLAGRARAGMPLQLTVRDPGGALRSKASLDVDGRGRFDQRLIDAAGQPVLLSPGDRIVLLEASSQAELIVDPLSFDYSPEVGIQGHTLPHRDLKLSLTVTDHRAVLLDLRSDALGRFALLATDLSPRGSWTFEQVTAIEIGLPKGDGNATVTELLIDAREQQRLFLPWVRR